MTQTPYGGQSYATTGTPFSAPSLEQPSTALPPPSEAAQSATEAAQSATAAAQSATGPAQSAREWAIPAPVPGAGHAGGFESYPARHGGDTGFSDPVITEVSQAHGPEAPIGHTDGGMTQPPSAAPDPQPYRSNRSARARGPRRARLQLRHINPWTVLKFSCVLSVALFFVWLITIGVLFGVLEAAGVIAKINDTVTTINGSGAKDPVTPGIVFGGAAIIGVVNIVLFIALSTIGSVVYNLCADLVGGIEVTLSERES